MRSVTTTTPVAARKWADHQDWGNCTGCPLHKYRFKPVLARGYLPADVLFVGEAPGESENIAGIPFDPNAPAGEELQALINSAWAKAEPELPFHRAVWCITNIVACFPQKSSQGDFREPTKEEAKACQQRLVELINICKPKLVVTLGLVAKRYLPIPIGRALEPAKKGEFLRVELGPPPWQLLNLIHPSAICRADENDKLLMRKRFIHALATALEKL